MEPLTRAIDYCITEYPILLGLLLSAAAGVVVVLLLYRVFPIRKK